MKLLANLCSYFSNGTKLDSSLTSFISTPDGVRFINKLDQMERELSACSVVALSPPQSDVCSVCGEHQTDSPSGPVCKNSHGGADLSTLTDSQLKAVSMLKEWLSTKRSNFFAVKGYAGSGKTFLLKHLKTVFAACDGISDILYATPTHKAANVLSKAADVKVTTLASLLGVRASQDSEEMEFVMPDELPDLPSNALLVVDESSMVSSQYLEFLELVSRRYSLRIIFFGDPAQLPPVGEPRSPVWKFVSEEDSVVLFEVKRYEGSLLELATELRSRVFSKDARHTELRPPNCDQIRVVGSLERAINEDLENFKQGHTKIVAWRNSTVDAYAASIRKSLGFVEPYSVGERYNLRKSVLTTFGIECGTPEDEVLITSRDEDRGYEIQGHRIPCLLLGVTGPFTATIRAVLEEDEVFLTEALSKLARLARKAKGWEQKQAWRNFWSVKNSFAQMKSAYSLTAHRAQGSQFSTVYVDAVDILANHTKSEAYRCLYVACTRVQDNLVIRL